MMKRFVKDKPKNNLPKDDFLLCGEKLKSDDGLSELIVQDDGNLVLYQKSKAVWASNTSRKDFKGRVVMQGDGNLVLYDDQWKPMWASNTSSQSGCTLRLQDDGNLVIYTNESKAIWASNTNYK